MATTYQITANPTANGWEVTFPAKPSEAVRTALKSLGLRWHSQKQCWYISRQKATEEQLVSAIRSASDPTGDPAEAVTDGYLGGGAISGSKSHLGLYGADLTAAIRADLKAAGLKGVTVRHSRGSGVAVTVPITPADTLTPTEYAEIWKPEGHWISTDDGQISRDAYYDMTAQEQQELRRKAAEHEITQYQTGEQSVNHYYVDRYNVFAAAYREKLKRVLAIVSQYHYDASNSMVDYFDSNFFLSLYTKPAKTK